MKASKKEIVINGVSEIPEAAAELIGAIGDAKVVAFYGRMGAGKTTLIREICRQKGVRETVASPSFAIVNAYNTADGEPVYHFDFYRIRDVREAYDLGYEEYFFGGDLCLIEWPEIVEELLPTDCLRLRIEAPAENKRVVSFL